MTKNELNEVQIELLENRVKELEEALGEGLPQSCYANSLELIKTIERLADEKELLLKEIESRNAIIMEMKNELNILRRGN